MAALVLAGGTLVSLEHDGIPREGTDAGVAGAARALANLVEHVRPVPDALTLYTERGIPAADALAAASADVRDAFDATRVRGSERTSPFSEEFLAAFAEETTPNTRTRFHANPWLYAEPIRLVTDASVLYDANDDPLSSSAYQPTLDDRNAIVAMEARTVDEPDPNAAEYRLTRVSDRRRRTVRGTPGARSAPAVAIRTRSRSPDSPPPDRSSRTSRSRDP